jgi:hypothetical protein
MPTTWTLSAMETAISSGLVGAWIARVLRKTERGTEAPRTSRLA